MKGYCGDLRKYEYKDDFGPAYDIPTGKRRRDTTEPLFVEMLRLAFTPLACLLKLTLGVAFALYQLVLFIFGFLLSLIVYDD